MSGFPQRLGLRGALRRLSRRRRSGGCALILAYHRVGERLPSDPHALRVTPSSFSEQLTVLRRRWMPLRLEEIVSALHVGDLPPHAVVVTFDDGYADNLECATPLLERYDVPATVFITTGYLGGRREFWWDELERILLHSASLPATLTLTIGGRTRRWRVGSLRDGDARPPCAEPWNVEMRHAPTARHALYRALHPQLRPLEDTQRQAVLEQLRRWSGIDAGVRPTHRPLSVEELVRLAAGGRVDIGAHTVTHPVLAALPVAAQQREIQASKEQLEFLLGAPVNSFAYPYGSSQDYAQRTVALVRAAGFASACANIPEPVWQGSDPYQLPRFLVRDWDGEEFSRRLRAWFHA